MRRVRVVVALFGRAVYPATVAARAPCPTSTAVSLLASPRAPAPGGALRALAAADWPLEQPRSGSTWRSGRCG